MANMVMENDRLKTLTLWPVNFIDKLKIARAGFYYEGNGSDDRVKCFQCHVIIGQWVHYDEPNEEHIKWSRNCRYIILLINPPMEHEAKYSPAYPKYGNYNERMKTFKEWPISLPVKSIDLAKAGFFYIGNGDKCCCFFCNSVLTRWVEGDDPFEEHARWNSDCVFLLTIKGEKYIEAVQKKYSSNTIQLTETTIENSKDNDENSEVNINDESSCKICFDNRKNICFIPCGHILACADCSFAIFSCPTCRCPIKNRQRIYFS